MRLIVLISLLFASLAHAYDPDFPEACGERELYEDHHIDCHFQEDARRLTFIDDRGGQGIAYGFYLDPRPENPGAWDLCHNCALSVMVADPGIDYDDFEFLGLSLQDIDTIGELVPVIEDLLSEDPVALANELWPNLEGQDLEGMVAEVMRIKDRAAPLVEKLRKLERLQNLDFDFEQLDDDFPAFAEDLGIKSDAAFRGDFDNPNDERRNNSGVTVYTLPRFLQSMVDNNVPAFLRDQAEALLSNIMGLPGLLEISGDDDNAMNPVTFHGISTDLNIEARSFVVNGTNAILQTYTVINNTRRFLPLVQVAMITDFDMPPLSTDTSTEFDPARFAVMVYDNAPTYEPVQHYWYASAPAPGGVGLGAFVPANWNIDKNLSLAQAALSIHFNRIKFFLWHPDVSGDHDDAQGKSEKQGAVSQLLVGPLRPGERRQVAFCRAAGKAESSAQAQVEMYAQLDACRALYALITPECGNGQLELMEECDDGNGDSGDGCAACKVEECGDGNQVGAEECDDGNHDANDGCGPTCRTERLGDGVVQANEQCDDGNLDPTDGCLNDGTLARCGDGYVRVCNPEVEDCGGCLGRSICLSGEATVVSSRGSTPALDTALNQRIRFQLGFDIESQAAVPGRLEITTGPVALSLRGDAELEAAAPLLAGDPWTITVLDGNPIQLSSTRLSGGNRDSTYTLEFTAEATRRGMGVGFAGLQIDAISLIINRFTPRLREPTDTAVATGDAQLDQRGEGVAVELCDDGNGSNFDLCTNTCQPAACGDGFVQLENGEECDVVAAWCDGCRLVDAQLCGNGLIEADRGETCDDGGRVDGDGCSAICRLEVCGDGVVQAPEACDDGNDVPNDGCNPACSLEFCGDGVVQPGEECDDGALAETGACRPGCHAAACGDGFVQAGVEACDDGNTAGGDGCNAACVTERCGDGAAGPGEACDDGNDVAGDGCTDCQVDFCGDGRPGPGEQCDDGNPVDGDGCTKQCALDDPEACGDGTPDPGEQCDDGNTAAGDGCDATCRLENPAACGNGQVDAGEGCDDGNVIPGDGCSATCTTEGCGDNIQQPGEGCDDGDREPGDGCDANCAIEPATCGNGVHEVGEQCDDGNDDPNDGCDACRMPVDIPTLNQTCGNDTLDAGEQCDDGDRDEGDGCDSLCQLEAAVCGNGRLERGEQCDPGVAADRQGCGPDCRFGGVCGNGTQEVGEGCDDGNTAAGDGCDETCRAEDRPDTGPRPDGGADPADAGPDSGACVCPEAGPCDCPGSGGGGGCGCDAADQSSPPWPALLLAALVIRRRRRAR